MTILKLKLKLLTALGAILVLVAAGVEGVRAQALDLAQPSITNDATVVTITDPKKAEPSRSTESVVPAPTAEVSADITDSTAVIDAGMPAVLPSGQSADAGKWQFQITPYFWMAGLHGTVGIRDRTTRVEQSFSDVFHDLNFAFMGTFEARRDKLVVLADFQYVNLDDDRATPGPLFGSAEVKIKMTIFDPEVGYRVYDDPEKGAFVDVLGGVRIVHISTDLLFTAGILPAESSQASRTWADAVGGLRAKTHISPKFFLTGKFDLGGGGSKFTYQLFGGVGYAINERIALIAGYRALDIDYRHDNFIYDISQRGPIVGIGFRF